MLRFALQVRIMGDKSTARDTMKVSLLRAALIGCLHMMRLSRGRVGDCHVLHAQDCN